MLLVGEAGARVASVMVRSGGELVGVVKLPLLVLLDEEAVGLFLPASFANASMRSSRVIKNSKK